MRRLKLMVGLLLVATTVGAQNQSNTDASRPVHGRSLLEGSAEQKFAPGGLIRLHLNSGGYVIRGTDTDTIVVSSDRFQRADIRIKATGASADVYIEDTPHNGFQATIEIPRRSDLWVRLTAAELKVQDVEGSKDIQSNAGSVEIEVARPEEYGHADASINAGDLNAAAFGVSKGGLFRSFHQEGKGKYRLHVHMLAGEIRLRPLI